jgi:tetratricopeptide (TPR) repeat protein/tRNA A-37 threonylcarbamoyl transferase component Bud32
MERTLVEGGAASSSDATLVTGADDADRTLVQGAGASEPSRIEGSSGGGSASSSEGIGFYQDVELIDQGGMGCILRATDGKIGRQVALKMLLSNISGHRQIQRRFLNEARITGQLEHPNIVPIHEMDRTEDGRDYFSMKLIQGRSLAERVETAAKRARATGKGHDGRRWLPDFLKICDAMSFAHSKRIIHRDLKPANVMVGEFGEVLVMDWGLAKDLGEAEGAEEETSDNQLTDSQMAQLDSGLTQTGQVMGTVAYMPPEQAGGQGGRVDARSDVYSLGAILYELLTLRPPFEGVDTQRILGEVRKGRLISPSERAPEATIPRELEGVVLRAMARKPVERYPDVKALQADIEAYLEGRTLAAADYNPLQLLGKWIGRNRTACTVATVALLLGGGLLGALAWRDQQNRNQRYETALHEAGDRIARVGDISRLTTERSVVDSNSGVERRDTPEERIFRKQAIEAYVAAAGALDRALLVRPGDPDARGRRLETGQDIGRMALQGGDYLLARQAFLQLEGHGVSSTDVADLVKKVETAERYIGTLRKKRLHAILEDLSRGLGRGGRPRGAPLLPDYVFEASGYRDRQTVEILGDNLRTLVEHCKRGGDAFAWSQAERDRATFLCRVLARLGLRECAPLLGEWMAVVTDPDMAIEAGLALCNTRRIEAEVHLLAARDRFGGNSNTWVAIQPFFERIPDREVLDSPSTPMEFWNRGQVFDEKKEYGRAIAAYTRAIELAPNFLEAYSGRGSVLSSQGNPDAAIADFSKVIEIDPGRWQCFLLRASAYVDQGNKDAALADLNQAIRINARIPFAYNRRGNLFQEKGVLDAALADYNRAILIDPKRAKFYSNRGNVFRTKGNLNAALADYTKSIELDPKSAINYCNRGSSQTAAGNLREAISDFNQAIELDPQYAPAYYARGRARKAQGDLNAAITDFDQAIAFNSAYTADVYSQRGQAFQEKGDLQEAIASYTRAIEIQPNRADLYRYRGFLFALNNDFDGAMIDFDKAIERDPNCAESYRNRGNTFLQKRDLKGALADYNRSIELDPKVAGAYDSRGTVLAEMKNWKAALADYNRSIELAPKSALFYYNRGNFFGKTGNLDAAIADLTRSCQLNPQYAMAFYSRGACLGNQGDLDAAIRDFTRAIELDPNYVQAYRSRSMALEAKGSLDGAIVDLQRVVELSPRDWQVWVGLSKMLGTQGRRREAVTALRKALAAAPAAAKPKLAEMIRQLQGER